MENFKSMYKRIFKREIMYHFNYRKTRVVSTFSKQMRCIEFLSPVNTKI